MMLLEMPLKVHVLNNRVFRAMRFARASTLSTDSQGLSKRGKKRTERM